MKLLIDGYNLMHASSDFLAAWDKGAGREALAAALKLYRGQKKHHITLVFDGGPDPEPTRASLSGVPVVFAGTRRSADDLIAEMACRQGAGLTVITDDRELAGRCRRHGSEVIGSREFAPLLLEAVMGSGPEGLEEEDEGWDFSTRKKGPSRRLPKSQRRALRRRARL